jgi:transposase
MSKDTEGIKVTDRFSAYTIIDPDKRQLCWAHLKRDFARLKKVKYEVG